jgi:hypothetical protein
LFLVGLEGSKIRLSSYLLAQNINRIGALGGFASEPAFGLVRLPAAGRVGALANLDLLVLLGQAKRTEKQMVKTKLPTIFKKDSK